MSVDKLAHVVWECKYHNVIVPKYRYKFFGKDVRTGVKDELKKLCVWMRTEILGGKVCEDHIHMCISMPPKLSVSNVVGTLKGKTLIRMFEKLPEIRKRY